MSNIPSDSAWQRAPRPLIGWAGVLLLLVCIFSVAAIMGAIAVGYWMTAARGQSVPDVTGGLAVLIPAVAAAWGTVAQYLASRSRERRDAIAYGAAPPPFASAPSSPPPEEPAINPHGGPGAP